jgi:dihydroflavonol-4-reductase
LTLVTGGSGFVGSHVASLLAERGDDLRLLLRPKSKLDNLGDLEFDRVDADVLDRRAVRRAMKGVERVFHCAGLVSTRRSDVELLYRVNVEGTRIVLEEALRAGVERVVHTSSVGSLGPAPAQGKAVDERQLFTAGRLGIHYINSKHEGEVEALRIAAQGLPVVVVNPGHVFGSGDLHHGSTTIVRRFLYGRIPIYANGGLNVVAVEDVARGHLLADERGTPGERYILGNRNYSLDRLFSDLSRLSGVEPPPLRLQPAMALRLATALEAAAGDGRVPISSQDVKLMTNWWVYRNTKAKRELGFQPSPHEDTIEETVEWYMEREGDRLARSRRTQPIPYKLTATALGAVERLGGSARRLWPRG